MDVTIQSGDHELSLADFLDGCAKVVNAETSTVVRSSLEDFDKKVIGNNEHFERKIFDIGAPEAPEKHGILYLHIIFNATGLLSLDPSVLTARHT